MGNHQTTTRGPEKSISREPKKVRREARQRATVSTAHAVCADCGRTSETMTKQTRGKTVVNLCASCSLAWEADRHESYLKPMTAHQRRARGGPAASRY